MLRKLFSFVVLFLSFNAYANSVVTGAKVVRVHFYQPTHVFVKLDKPRNATPCSGDANFFVIDVSTKSGELLYSHVLSAFHGKSNVDVTGTGQCGHFDIESIQDFQIYH